MNEINESGSKNVCTTLEFKEVPEFLNISNQSLNNSSENAVNGVNSEIIFQSEKKVSINKMFSIKMNVSDLVDWVRNIIYL